MAMRRPRIKAVANIQLNSKRKVKPTTEERNIKTSFGDINSAKGGEKIDISKINEEILSKVNTLNNVENNEEVRVESSVETESNKSNFNNNTLEHEINNGVQISEQENVIKNNFDSNAVEKNVHITKDDYNNDTKVSENHFKNTGNSICDSNAFKSPTKFTFQRSVSNTSNSGVDDVFYSDIEENALQMDLEKSSPMSPSKNQGRQRIRPTPHFCQRRNSFVGTSPSHGNEDNDINCNANNEFIQPTQTRRERHHSASVTGNNNSASLSHHLYHHTTHRYLPTGVTNTNMGRIRTESGCSVLSDTNTSLHKSRKVEDHKQNSRKEFEARFINGVPEKSTLKMSDLIYYNPSSNPMEQKPNLNVKFEKTDTSSNDGKPFERKEKDLEELKGDDIPVPQLKLNAKGELILDDSSLVIETTAEQEARKMLANSTLIYLDENTGMNGFYSRQKRTREWLPSETIKFYRCLQNVGTDFSLMVSLFPNRSRRDLKLKFKKEERKNGHLINKALLYPKQFNLDALKQQMEEEEKMREEQVKKAKISKEKKKESKKRKICTPSVSNRILLSEEVYHNENVQNTKKVLETCTSDKSEKLYQNENDQNPASPVEINITDKNIENCKNIADEKSKRLRTNKETNNILIDQANERTVGHTADDLNKQDNTDFNKIANTKANKQRRKQVVNNLMQKEEREIIKKEIKTENKQESTSTPEQDEFCDIKQLQTEMDELLDSDAPDIICSTSYNAHDKSNSNVVTRDMQNVQQNGDFRTESYPHYITDNYYCESNTEIDKCEHRTIVNLDDGSVNIYKDDNYTTLSSSPLQRSHPPPFTHHNKSSSTIPASENINNETCSSVISDCELNEEDIQQILTELAEGSLVLVSTLDPDDPDKVLNEIYMVDKTTGELCDEPLDIPDNVVQCILTVAS